MSRLSPIGLSPLPTSAPAGWLPADDPAGAALAAAIPAAADALPTVVALTDGDDARAFFPAAIQGSPHPAPPAPESQESAWWRWWLTDRLALVEMAPSLLCHDADRTAWARLEAALALLHRRRPRRPVDALVLVTSLAALGERSGSAAKASRRCRRIVDEIAQTLGWRVPLLAVVGGLQSVPGHDDVFASYPEDARGRPLGYRPADGADPRTMLSECLSAVDQIASRCRILAVAGLAPGASGRTRAEHWQFADRLAEIRPGVEALVKSLVAPGQGGAHPPFRGLFLVAPGAATSHLRGLVDTLLPADLAAAAPAGRSG